MIGKMTSAGSASLLVLLLAAGAAFACPPTKTWTTGPADDTGLVLAEGPAVTAERIAGPFEVPFSVGILPDGSFLVTERPGRLKHVKPGATSQDVTGVPAVLYVGQAACSMSRSTRTSTRTASSTCPICKAARRNRRSG